MVKVIKIKPIKKALFIKKGLNFKDNVLTSFTK